jgi:hypothetical protein
VSIFGETIISKYPSRAAMYRSGRVKGLFVANFPVEFSNGIALVNKCE